MIQGMRKQQGFTLIEMMVVLAIIALIAVFAIPSITNALQNSRIKSVEAQARQIQNAFDSYYNDNNSYPDPGGNWANAGVSYTYFLGDNAVLQQYLSLPSGVASALFIPTVYRVETAGSQTYQAYELVIEVKNVSASQKYIHITKGAVTRSSSSAATLKKADGTTDATERTITG